MRASIQEVKKRKKKRQFHTKIKRLFEIDVSFFSSSLMDTPYDKLEDLLNK